MKRKLGSFVAVNRRAFFALAVVLSLAVFGFVAWRTSAQNQSDENSGDRKAQSIKYVDRDPSGIYEERFDAADKMPDAEKEDGKMPEVEEAQPSADLITATTYAFSFQNAAVLDDMSTGTTQLIAAGLDDTASAVTNIGFDF